VCAPCPHPVSVVYQPRLVALVSIDGAEAGTRSVSAYCADCRCVLEPRLDDVYVSEGVLADDKRYGRSIDHASRSIGQPGPWKRLGLPSWSDVAERRGIERISRSALFEDYTAHDRARVGELIQHHLGLSRGRSTRSMAAPAPIANIHVSLETVKHFLDDFFVHRQGVSHLRYLPLVSRTVEDPLEVWESTKAIYHRGTTLLFSPTLSRREFGNKSHGSRRREYWLGGHGIQHRRRCVRGASRRIVSFC
jgi:hypothetical protein